MQLRRIAPLLQNPNRLLREQADRSFFDFVRIFWSTVVNDPPVFNWHIPYVCAELTKMIQRVVKRQPSPYDLVLNVPPGSTKSLLTTVFFVAWCWSKWPWLQFIKTSYSSTLSLEHAEKCRDLIRSEKYQAMYPHIRIKRDKDKKTNFKIQFMDGKLKIWKQGGNLFSTSVEGTVTGFHAHFLLTDDPIDPFKAYSKTQLENVNRWLRQVLPTRKTEKEIVPHAMIMQRVDMYDPSADLLGLEEEGYGVRHICLPGTTHTVQDEQNVKPPELLKYYKRQGGYLDPKRIGDVALHKLQIALGQYGFAAQIQQDPMAAAKGMFQVSEIEIVKLSGFNLKVKLLKKVRYWDKAGTDDGGTYTVGVLMCKLKNGLFLVEDVVRGQWASHKRESMITTTTIKDGNAVTQIVEQEPGSGGKESAYATRDRLKGLGYKCLIDRPTGDKVYRADPFSVMVNNGSVLLVEASWNADYLDELMRFPGGAKTMKDQVDSSSGAYAGLTFGKRVGAW